MAAIIPGLNPNNFNERVKKTRFGRSRLRDKTYLDRTVRYGKEWAALLLSDLAYEDGNDNEAWIPARPLGKGSFGKVALWEKRDEMGDVIDTLAMKELDAEQDEASGYWSRNLVKEAFIQSQLTSVAEESFINLRNYRFYGAERKARLYMEYAKFGSLEDIRRWYRSWDKYLPEEFLWLVFHELALAAEAMEQCPKIWQPFSNDPEDQQNPANYVLHCDLKGANVFLGERTRMQPANTFPAKYAQVKLGDFGLSEVTGPASGNNPDEFFGLGDPDSLTPEQQNYGQGWPLNPPMNANYQAANGFQFSERQNVWQVGLIIHDLMKLSKTGEVQAKILASNNAGVASYQQHFPGTNRPRQHFMDWPESGNIIEYSNRLRLLIWECLRPRVTLRPTPANLVHRTRVGLQASLEDRRTQGGNRQQGRAQNVAFTRAEMNKLPHGGNNMLSFRVNCWDPDDGFEWAEMRDVLRQEPDEPRIHPPDAKWRAFYRNEMDHFPDYVWEDWRHVGGQVHPVDEDAHHRRPKRIGSFDGSNMDDLEVRRTLERTKQSVQVFAGNKPMAMIEYVLQKEKMDEEAAQQILEWLYRRGAQARPEWRRWEQKQENHQKAARVRQRGHGRWTERECLYFVATSGFGPEQADAAVDALNAVYNTV